MLTTKDPDSLNLSKNKTNKSDQNSELDIILSYPKLNHRLESHPKEKARVIKLVQEIRSDVSLKSFSRTEKFLDSTFAKLYQDVVLEETSKTNLAELAKSNNIVLVPNHQSHADYIALSYAIWKRYKFPMYIAGGKNLNVFPIGPIFRKCGCFFIRRSFAHDVLYKLTLEAYLYFLLYTQKPIEFFFEGGRSRTGKLRPPKFGLYKMIMEAFSQLPKEMNRKLCFVPVSINHEYVPEGKSLAKELKGSKKTKESARQVFGLYKLFKYDFGTIHLTIGDPITYSSSGDFKQDSHKMAFDCFLEVGHNLRFTPSSLLALILLDEDSSAMEWEEILARAWTIVSYLDKFKLPYTEGLQFFNLEGSLKNTLSMLISNKKLNIIGSEKEGGVFYSIKSECRQELLYFKNSVLHHLMIPWVINAVWMKIFNGQVSSAKELKALFLTKRDQLKYEFYLPTAKEFFNHSLEVISDALGKKVETIEDCLHPSPKELFDLATNIGVFSRSCHYLVEAYYSSFQTVKALYESNEQVKSDGFTRDEFMILSKKLFQRDLELGKLIRYRESYQEALLRNGLKLLENKGFLKRKEDRLILINLDGLEDLLQAYEQDLLESLSFNVKIQKV